MTTWHVFPLGKLLHHIAHNHMAEWLKKGWGLSKHGDETSTRWLANLPWWLGEAQYQARHG